MYASVVEGNFAFEAYKAAMIKAGDTLPLLCQCMFRDSGYFSKVVRIKRLTLLRQLGPGMSMCFPPLA